MDFFSYIGVDILRVNCVQFTIKSEVWNCNTFSSLEESYKQTGDSANSGYIHDTKHTRMA